MDDNKNKVLRLRDVVLYTVSAMLFMDQIALASSSVRRACSGGSTFCSCCSCRWP
ncbi:hypothetical protein P4204_07005 [Pseudomonas aeruginosa]|nr:hypothetical protein [Pseudomonas aeruginosa]MDF5876143.1 hypothetical protein [Pseudomonas aeruginosa]